VCASKGRSGEERETMRSGKHILPRSCVVCVWEMGRRPLCPLVLCPSCCLSHSAWAQQLSGTNLVPGSPLTLALALSNCSSHCEGQKERRRGREREREIDLPSLFPPHQLASVFWPSKSFPSTCCVQRLSSARNSCAECLLKVGLTCCVRVYECSLVFKFGRGV